MMARAVRRLGFIAASMSVSLVNSSLANAEAGVTDRAIQFGMVTGLTGTTGKTGEQIRAGYEAAFERTNRAHGIYGRKLKLSIFDDHYDSAVSAVEIHRLMRNKNHFALVGANGTSTITSILPLVVRDGIPFLFPRTGATALRDFHHNVFNSRPSFAAEIEALIHYGATHGRKRIAIIYQMDALGDSIRGAAVRAVEKERSNNLLPVRLVAVTGIDRETTEGKYIAANFERIEIGDPDMVILATAIAASSPLVHLAAEKKKKWLFLSVSNTNNLVNEIRGLDTEVVFGQVVPDPAGPEKLPIFEEYRADMIRRGSTEFGSNSFEAYLNGRLLIDALKRAGPHPTRAKLIHGLEGDPFSVGGLSFDWSDIDHNGAAPVYLARFFHGDLVTLPITARAGAP